MDTPILAVRFFILTTVLGVALGGDPIPEKGDFERIQGVWRFRKMEVDLPEGGKLAPESEIQKDRLIFKGNTYTWVLPDKKLDPETFDLQRGREQKWIEITKTVRAIEPGAKPTDPVETQTWKLHGIYELTDTTLKICMPIMPTGSNIRPQEFSAGPGTGCVVWILERVKD